MRTKIFKITLILLVVFGANNSLEAKEKVKNIILLIGDGMGLSQITMTMVENDYKPTIFDEADNVALQKTHSANNRITDSAAAGTALATGHKTNNNMLGVTPDGKSRESILKKASKQGKRTGIVATSSVQHATPAAFYANVKSRNDYMAIARQLSDSPLDVAIGGGAKFMAQEINGETLIEKMQNKGYTYAKTLDELKAAKGEKLLGLLAEDGMPSINKGRNADYLSLATSKALEILSRDRDGFFLMVEGSQIDWEGHANNTRGIKAEMQDFERAVTVALDFARTNKRTLVIVTADHETGGMSLASGNADFTLSDSGVHYKYGTKGHSGTMVPIFLYGAGAEQINGVIDNTELSKQITQILR